MEDIRAVREVVEEMCDNPLPPDADEPEDNATDPEDNEAGRDAVLDSYLRLFELISGVLDPTQSLTQPSIYRVSKPFRSRTLA